MGIDLHLSTCVCIQSPKYLEMAQRHISLSILPFPSIPIYITIFDFGRLAQPVLHVHPRRARRLPAQPLLLSR
jgi:hypothetical protein